MGITERREKEKEIRRNDILDAAERVFLNKEFAATMDDIATEAEFTKKTIYSYYASKEQIYFEIMIRGYQILLEKFKETVELEKASGMEQKLTALAVTMDIFRSEYPVYFKIIMDYENGESDFDGVQDESKQACYQIGEEILKQFQQVLKEGIENGNLKKALPINQTALLLWMFLMGVFQTSKKKKNYLEFYYQTDEKQLLLEAVKLMWNAVKES